MSVLDSVAEYVRHKEGRQHVYDVSGHEGSHTDELCMSHARAAKTLHTDSNTLGLETGLIHPQSHDPGVQVVRPHQGTCRGCATQLRESERPSNVGPRPPVSDVSPGARSPYSPKPSYTKNEIGPYHAASGQGREWDENNEYASRAPEERRDDEWAPKVQDHLAPNGKSYRLVHKNPNYGASTVTAHVPMKNGGYRGVGYLSYTSRPDKGPDASEIYKTHVHPDHQRQGLASAMLSLARESRPGLEHSHALTDDGKAWSERVGVDKQSVLEDHSKIYYHVSDSRNRASIAENGLSLDHSQDAKHIWLHPDEQSARAYRDMPRGRSMDGTSPENDIYRVNATGYRTSKEPHGVHDFGQRVVKQSIPPDRLERLDRISKLEEDGPHERNPHQERLDPRAGGRGRGKGQNPQVQVAQDPQGSLSEGSPQGSELRPLREHPQVDADLRKIPSKVQDTYFDRVDSLRRGERHSSTHPLNGPLKGWHGTSIGGTNWRMIHRSTPDGLEVKAVGQHQPAYEQAIRRSMAKYFTPTERIFTHTCGLDHRLWDANEHLRPDVRSYIMQGLGSFWASRYHNWSTWSRVYFAGSEASEWTSDTLEGNSDFDVLVGVDFDVFRRYNSNYANLTNAAVAEKMNKEFKDGHLNNKNTYITIGGVKTGPWDRTTFVNANAYDIRNIKPYAAYDVGEDKWIVRPPHLTHWDIKSFPKEEVAELHAIENYVKAVLKLKEPERTQQGAALFQHLHSDRSRAFSDRGEGWYDVANVAEKYLDQEGLWAELIGCAHRAKEGLDKAPADWSNTPPGYTAALEPEKIHRGFIARPERGWDRGSAQRIGEGTANLHDIMSHVDHKTPGGNQFWHHSDHGDLEDAKDYAWGQVDTHPKTWLDEGRKGRAYGDVGVVFEGKKPHDWHPDENLPGGKSHDPEKYANEGGDLMGHSSLPEGHKVDLHAVHYQDAQDNWHRLDAQGHHVVASKVDDLYGSHDLDKLFPSGPLTVAPFPQAGRSKSKQDYDKSLVARSITHPHEFPIEKVDPRELRATQPSITRPGVSHYLSGEKTPYADAERAGNDTPRVYHREDGQKILLSGHHRGSAALLRGEPLEAHVIRGPFGGPR